MFAITNLTSLNSLENLLLLAVEGFGDLPNLPFSEEWVKRISILKIEGYRKWNWLKRIHPEVRVLKWKTGLHF